MKLNVVLVEPEIPQNTGNIARTCSAVGAKLHLIEPLGFSVENKYLKRAGLDYWDMLDIEYHKNLEEFFNKHFMGNYFFATTKAINTYADVCYEGPCFIFFGKETKGLPEELLYSNKEKCIRIPMVNGARSLNLSNSVAVVVYEALRQNNFEDLLNKGNLTKYNWK
jgi:tRNA (cytidine/uridine-2'-O-)-methyltransferase